MKAIHNSKEFLEVDPAVVYANAKILKWKQFTTITENNRTRLSCLC